VALSSSLGDYHSPSLILLHQPTTAMSNTERTFIAVKPDGVQRGIFPEVLRRFSQKGFKLVAIKLTFAKEDLLKEHYADLVSKPFFPSLLSYMMSGPVLATVWEGKDVVKQGRVLLGATNPLASAPGTIRGDFALDMGRNIIHGSDSVESANKEIDLWFKKEELVDYKSAISAWIYE
jgi:nucleoside-diphosphate kinase